MRASEDQLKAMMVGGLNGDAVAYRSLLSALAPVLRSFFGRRLRDAAEDIEDLVQETLMAIHTRRATYDRERLFLPWVYAVARHKWIDLMRRRKAHVILEDVEHLLLVGAHEDSTLAAIDIENMLSLLPTKQAQVIRATRLNGLSVAETARDSGLSESDVKVSVHRGLKMLTTRLLGN